MRLVKRPAWTMQVNGHVVYRGPCARAWVQYWLTVAADVQLFTGKGRCAAHRVRGMSA